MPYPAGTMFPGATIWPDAGTFPSTPTTSRVARASYQGWISWLAFNVGLSTFDFSTFDGPDLFGVSPTDTTFAGAYDDVSDRLEEALVAYGRNTNLDSILAGEATLLLADDDGLFNPQNPTSPLHGDLEERLHPVKLVSVFEGVTYPLFYGWTRRFVWEPRGRRGFTRVECVDLLYWLERARPIIASTGPTTTGTAIGLVLDDAGIVDPALRDLDTGDTIPDFSADGSQSGLQVIAGLLAAERGVFYAAPNGAATYRDRLSRLTSPSLATIANRMSAIAPGVDFDSAKTRVTVRRTQNEYTAVATSDAATIGKLGIVDLPLIETPYLLADADADGLSQWVRAQVEKPAPPIYGMRLDNRQADLLTQILARQPTDRVTVSENVGGTIGDVHIEQVRHTITGGRQRYRHQVDWLLSSASLASPIVFDASTFDSPAVFAY